MKKNWTMRVAILMVALTLITSCFVSGTFAKYVTSGGANDTARVAKFGVTVTADGAAFATAYAKDDNTVTVEGLVNTVETSNGDKLVAPGTTHDVAAVTLTGTPEVAVKVTYAANVNLAGWTTDGSTEYCPIVFTLNGATYGTEDTDAANKSANVADLAAALKNAIEATTSIYPPNADLSGVANPVALSWAWPFETGADADAKAANDVKDTALGNAAANGTAAVIGIELTVTVTQIN